MRTYKARTLISGYKIADFLKGKIVVAVPDSKSYKAVEHNQEIMEIKSQPLYELVMRDKFPKSGRPPFYTLQYHEWQPTKQLQLLKGE